MSSFNDFTAEGGHITYTGGHTSYTGMSAYGPAQTTELEQPYPRDIEEDSSQGGDDGMPPKKRSRRTRDSPSVSNHAPTKPLQHRQSKLGQRREMLGDRMGSNFKEKRELRFENGVMLAMVNNEWKPAGFHREYREEFILQDAQQPGAPVWEKGMSLDYTSYSPVTSNWTQDPGSIIDSKGRQVALMSRPVDWQHNPKTSYLEYEGLVMLDHNNQPVKDYPGAPLTLSTKAPPHLLLGLQRCFGMITEDLMARMDIFRNTPKGIKPLAPTSINERVRRWRKCQEEKGIIIPAWHQRQKSGCVKNGRGGKLDDPSDPEESDDGEEEAPTPHNRPTPYYPPSPGTSAATTASTGFTQHQSLDAYPLLHEAESYLFSGADRNSGVPGGSYTWRQLSMEGEEQMYEDICSNVPDFPGANLSAQTANVVISDNINTPFNPFDPASTNIYPCNPFDAASTNIYPFSNLLNQPMPDIPFQGYPEYIQPQLDGPHIFDNSWHQDSQPISTPIEPTSTTVPSPVEDPFMGADWDWSLAESLL